MYPDRDVEQRHVVVDTPGERRETFTETTQQSPREFSLSPGTVAALVILAMLVIGLTYYVVSNKNANEEANRQVALETSKTQSEQPTSAQQPVIIQPAAPQQQAPIIVQQPGVAADSSSPLDDLTIQDAASKRLTDDPNLSSVSVIVISGKATLTGTVSSSELRNDAERVVRAVRGVKSIENKIEISR